MAKLVTRGSNNFIYTQIDNECMDKKTMNDLGVRLKIKKQNVSVRWEQHNLCRDFGKKQCASNDPDNLFHYFATPTESALFLSRRRFGPSYIR